MALTIYQSEHRLYKGYAGNLFVQIDGTSGKDWLLSIWRQPTPKWYDLLMSEEHDTRDAAVQRARELVDNEMSS